MSDLPKPESSKSIKTETHACPDPECAKVFSTTIKLNVHLRLEHNVNFKCSLCSKTFDTNAKLVSHKSVHEDESRSYVCHGCKLAFSDHCDYLIHEFTHSKFRSKFECPECGLISLFRSAIQRHVQKHFDKKQTCPICFEEIQTSKLPSHVGLHNSNRECVECGKRLLGKKQFDEHMTVHTGVKIHQCLYCGKGFGTKNQKAVHTRIHTNERLYSCKYCCRKFIQITDMKRHQAGHDKIRNIECQICKKKFIRAIDLQCHMKTHTKKYSCPECGKRFSVIVSLKLHLLQVHSSERPVECKPCGKRFASEHHYREHTTSKIHKRNLFKETKDS
ncbi:unnamed protein product [Arctia plantaginis]|uniref:C2H2-type domain-containing protein n=1 Tax=Arctia plantaginis TaxID=874455 RepID=A0A8S1AXB7_ARCPL|nr:unnamed protein product [Arctia plantaginis]